MTDTNLKSVSPKNPQVAVGAIVFHKDKILLVKRKYEPSKNQWAIPEGKVKWGETLQLAAEREIFEETGIRIKAGQMVHVFDLVPKKNSKYHYIIIDLEAEYISGEPRAGDDAIEARWCGGQELDEFDVTASTRNLLAEKYDL